MRGQPEPFLDRDAVAELVRARAVEAGQRLRSARQELGWTQQRLAELADTTPETVCRVELGALSPRDHLRIALAFAVVKDVNDIWPPIARHEVARLAAAS